jgi:hypothetical protein
VNDESDSLAVKQREDVIGVPTVVTELDDMLEVFRKLIQEGLEPREVLMKARR